MKEQGKPTEHGRRDWTIILIIILLGVLLIIFAAGRATRFAPRWKLDAGMGSNLDPDSDFLTNRPVGFFEPLDPSILTPPVWINVFLTPGATFPTRTPPARTNTPFPANTLAPTFTGSPTATLPGSTPTQPYIPPPQSTTTQRPPATNTPLSSTPTPILSPTNPPPATAVAVDLSITKTDGSITYTPGSPVTYTIVVTNNGSNNVTGATISDLKPAQVTTWGWCVSPCVPTANTNADLNAAINLASGASITYTILANPNPGATGDLINTASVSVPAGYTDTAPGNNTATDTDAPVFTADLSITKTDNATHYAANAAKTYTIVVTNNGPSDVTGATVTDAFTNPNILPGSVIWTCSGTGGGTCTASGSGNISDSVNLPAGTSVTYLVDITVVSSPSGDLVNTAMVVIPLGITDPVPGNDTAMDTDTLITTVPPPPEAGTKDNIFYSLPAGSTLTLGINLAANGDTAWDLVYYEFSLASLPPPDTFDGIWLDQIVIEISDGSNWYTIFNWGNNLRDTNTNVDYTLLTLPVPPPNTDEEMDERPIAAGDLYGDPPLRGIAIDIDSIVPPGTYTFIRFYAPPGDTDGQAEIDAIEILP